MKATVRIRKGLTRERILQEAFTLVDRGGLEALTMRSLAVRLDSAPMAVYNHYEDRDAILDALAEQAFTRMSEAAAVASKGRSGRSALTRIRAILRCARSLASQHPNVYRLAMTRPQKPAAALGVMAEALESLEQLGLESREAMTVYYIFVSLLQGLPFWREGHAQRSTTDDASCIAGDADRQFTAAVEWILSSLKRQRKPAPKV